MDRGAWIVGGAAAAAVAVAGLLGGASKGPAASAAQGRRRLTAVSAALRRRPERVQKLSPTDYGALLAAVRGTQPASLSPSEARAGLGLIFASGAEGPWPWEAADPGGERALAYAVIDAAVALLTVPGPHATATDLADEVGRSLRATIRAALDCSPPGDSEEPWILDRLPFHDPGWPFEGLDCDDYTPQQLCECEAFTAERKYMLPPRYHGGALWVMTDEEPEHPFDLSGPLLVPQPASPEYVLGLYRKALPQLGRSMVGRWGHLAGLTDAERAARRGAAWAALDGLNA